MNKNKKNKRVYINNKIIKYIKKRIYKNNKIYMMIMLLLLITITTSNVFGASDPTLVTKINSAFKKILSYLQKIATPIAGVSIATGVLMRKLSFGDS